MWHSIIFSARWWLSYTSRYTNIYMICTCIGMYTCMDGVGGWVKGAQRVVKFCCYLIDQWCRGSHCPGVLVASLSEVVMWRERMWWYCGYVIG